VSTNIEHIKPKYTVAYFKHF